MLDVNPERYRSTIHSRRSVPKLSGCEFRGLTLAQVLSNDVHRQGAKLSLFSGIRHVYLLLFKISTSKDDISYWLMSLNRCSV